ncbi:uncharacterized protein RJT21DRAFT_114146 [Scheffersomyces amazonensis]|uniref:uncharacterized protein n=1 Tax=Scheffersomyces amazonensis TaxID=1078765 RepID=UPI00315DB861
MTEYSNKVCYTMLHSRVFRENVNITKYVSDDEFGNVFVALTRYKLESDEDADMITVTDNDLDEVVRKISGHISENYNSLYNPSVEYCEYQRIVKSNNRLGSNDHERQILKDYNDHHRLDSSIV